MKHERENKTLLKFLRELKLFHGFPADVLQEFLECLEICHIPSNTILIKEGDVGEDMYIVVHGRLSVTKGLNGSIERIAEISAGEVVGEISLLIDQVRSCSVTTIRDCLLLKLTKKDFESISKSNPHTALEISKFCIERLVKTSNGNTSRANIQTISFVPRGADPEKLEVIKRIADAMQQYGKTILLNKSDIQFDLKTERQKAIQWFNELEFEYDYVIYLTDHNYTDWTKLCLRQADTVYIFANVDNDSEMTECELEIEKKDNIRVRKGLIFLHHAQDIISGKTQKWLICRNASEFHHVNIDSPPHINRIARIICGKSVGLVLSGGGARGMAHVGVLQALVEANVPIDLIGGSSAGSIFAALFALGCTADEMRDVCRDLIYVSSKLDYTFPYFSLTEGKLITQCLREYFKERLIEDTWIKMFCVSTNIDHNKIEIHEKGLISKAIRSSISLPGIYPAVATENGLLVDGGVLNNLPVDVMCKHLNAGRVIASYISESDDNYNVNFPTESVSGWKILWNKLHPFNKRFDLPRVDNLIMKTFSLNESKHQLKNAEMADYRFQLNMSKFGMLDFKSYNEIIDEGYKQAQVILARMKIK